MVWSCARHRTTLRRKATPRDDRGRTARNAIIPEDLLEEWRETVRAIGFAHLHPLQGSFPSRLTAFDCPLAAQSAILWVVSFAAWMPLSVNCTKPMHVAVMSFLKQSRSRFLFERDKYKTWAADSEREMPGNNDGQFAWSVTGRNRSTKY